MLPTLHFWSPSNSNWVLHSACLRLHVYWKLLLRCFVCCFVCAVCIFTCWLLPSQACRLPASLPLFGTVTLVLLYYKYIWTKCSVHPANILPDSAILTVHLCYNCGHLALIMQSLIIKIHNWRFRRCHQTLAWRIFCLSGLKTVSTSDWLSSVQAPILGVAWSLPTFNPEHPALSPSFSVWSSLLGVSLCFLLSSLGFVTLQPVTASGHQPVSLPSAPVFASHHVASLLKTVDNRLRYKVPPPK